MHLARLEKNQFFLLMALICAPIISQGQDKSQTLISIENYSNQIDLDTTIKRTQLSKEKVKQECVCDAIDYYTKNDTIIKITTWVLHTSINRFDYYFKKDTLIFARLTKKYNNELKS